MIEIFSARSDYPDSNAITIAIEMLYRINQGSIFHYITDRVFSSQSRSG